MSDTNLFGYGRSSQSKIIKPFIDRIRLNLTGKPLTSDNQLFFMSQLRSLLAMLPEFENRPKWVTDTESYRMKSEIVCFLSLFTALDLPEEPSPIERENINSLYESVKGLGNERGWNHQTLHVQFIRAMGNKVQNYIMNFVIPRKLDPIDYN